jgi:lipopolysaccharide transport system permease protein
MVVLLIFYQVVPSWSLLLFPLTFLILILVGVSFGLLITPIGMLYTDVAKAISMFMGFVMYLTPVVYVIPKEGFLKVLMELNPLTPLLEVNRSILLGMDIAFLNYFMGLFLIMVPVFLIALAIYRVSIPVIVERFSA